MTFAQPKAKVARIIENKRRVMVLYSMNNNNGEKEAINLELPTGCFNLALLT